MTEKYYSRKILDNFYKTYLCEGDSITYKHFQSGNVDFFQKRLKNMDIVEQVVYTECTNILRDIIYLVIDELTIYMKDWGDMIITGGEAFNHYFDMNDRVVSSDIDTKFVPRFMSPFDPRFFGKLQICKIIFWNKLGHIAKKYNSRFRERISELSKTHIGKMLSIRPCPDKICLKRRYTLMKKSQTRDVLIDVELFAFDLEIMYLDKKHVMGGILDMPLMRPYEIGYEVAFTRKRGIHTINPITNDIIYFKNILIASKLFLIEDLFIMKSLGLRPKKIKKDKKRMVSFSQKVLGIKGITSKTQDKEIFQKAVKSISPTPIVKLISGYRPHIPKKLPDPSRFKEYTTEPGIQVVKKMIVPGIVTRDFVSIDGFEKTDSRMYFNRKTQTWKMSRNPHYIRNKYNFRSSHDRLTYVPQKLSDTLYGYNDQRNSWISSSIIDKTAMIPFVGLKNKSIKELVKK